MGCDIHIYAEVRKDGKWQPAVPIVPDPRYWFDSVIDGECDKLGIDWQDPEYKKLEAKYRKMSNEEILSKFSPEDICWHCDFDDEFDDRNYAWFAVLCGVRGAYELDFGEPKELPDDVSSEVQAVSDRDGVDGHSHHWVTLQELLNFNWNAKLHRVGYFSETMFRFQLQEILNNKISYFPDRHDGKYDLISKDLMIKYILGHRDFFEQKHGRYCVKIERDITYKEEIGEEYIDKLIERLKSFGGPENVRIVFWFDN